MIIKKERRENTWNNEVKWQEMTWDGLTPMDDPRPMSVELQPLSKQLSMKD